MSAKLLAVPPLRRCMLAPVPEIAEAERLLDAAAKAHLVNNHGRTAELIAATDMPAIAAWTEAL